MNNPYAYQQTSLPIREITVTGHGQIIAKPDYAQIQIGVISESTDVTEAQGQNAIIMNRIIQSLLALGIEREDMQTETYNVFPRYDFVEGRQVFRGYEVTNSVTVKIREINEVGEVIDTAIKNGANRISQIEFKIEDENDYYEQALQLSLLNAGSKAKAIAETLGLSYMPIPIEVVEESVGSPILFKSVAMTDQVGATPIEQGTITISAQVRVKFQY